MPRETVYVCRDRAGTLFTATEELANVLDTFDKNRNFRPQNDAYRVVVATVPGLRAGSLTDASGERWRILSYPEGGYTTERFVERIGWVDTDQMPEEMGKAIAHALGVAWVSDWTPEEIIAQEG